MGAFDLDLLHDDDPFEVDRQAGHLSKHPGADLAAILEVWKSDPLFYAARPPAHWLMVAEVDGVVWQVPLAPARSGDPSRCRPIGCYEAGRRDSEKYRKER